MNRTAVLRWLATGVVLLLAGLTVSWQYHDYLLNPWTRDGLVRSQVVLMAPQVSGIIQQVHVTDNAVVRSGDPLFDLNDAPFAAAMQQAEAELSRAKALAALAEADAARADQTRVSEPGALSAQTVQDAGLRAEAARAAELAASAALEQARQRLAFTRVTAPADGYITGLTLTPGASAPAWQPLLGLIRADSFRIEAFFREDNIARIRVGQLAKVTLMSYPDVILTGSVESIGWGIARQNGSPASLSEDLLPVVSPTFEWIRLAQRIPIVVKLDSLPADVVLRMGETASVMIRNTP